MQDAYPNCNITYDFAILAPARTHSRNSISHWKINFPAEGLGLILITFPISCLNDSGGELTKTTRILSIMLMMTMCFAGRSRGKVLRLIAAG